MPTLRSQAEFFMTGVIPVGPQRNLECTICTEPLVTDVVQIVACGHFFHCVCVLTWLQGHNSYQEQNRACPNCRRELYEGSPRLRAARRMTDQDETRSTGDGHRNIGRSNSPLATQAHLDAVRLRETQERLRLQEAQDELRTIRWIRWVRRIRAHEDARELERATLDDLEETMSRVFSELGGDQ